MKRALLISTIVLSGIAGIFGQDKPKEGVDFVSTSKTEFRGRLYEYHLDSNDLKDTPSWRPSDGEPPLSISAAARIAQDNFLHFVDNPKGWEISSMRLTSTSRNKWYYYITVSCMKTECLNGSARGFHILIKLDGFVVMPTFVPVEKKDVNW
jgi:hypothetical protein